MAPHSTDILPAEIDGTIFEIGKCVSVCVGFYNTFDKMKSVEIEFLLYPIKSIEMRMNNIHFYDRRYLKCIRNVLYFPFVITMSILLSLWKYSRWKIDYVIKSVCSYREMSGSESASKKETVLNQIHFQNWL